MSSDPNATPVAAPNLSDAISQLTRDYAQYQKVVAGDLSDFTTTITIDRQAVEAALDATFPIPAPVAGVA
jgi:hypothetical protein